MLGLPDDSDRDTGLDSVERHARLEPIPGMFHVEAPDTAATERDCRTEGRGFESHQPLPRNPLASRTSHWDRALATESERHYLSGRHIGRSKRASRSDGMRRLVIVRCAPLGWTFRRARSGTKGGVVRFRSALDSESVSVTLAALDRAGKLGQQSQVRVEVVGAHVGRQRNDVESFQETSLPSAADGQERNPMTAAAHAASVDGEYCSGRPDLASYAKP